MRTSGLACGRTIHPAWREARANHRSRNAGSVRFAATRGPVRRSRARAPTGERGRYGASAGSTLVEGAVNICGEIRASGRPQWGDVGRRPVAPARAGVRRGHVGASGTTVARRRAVMLRRSGSASRGRVTRPASPTPGASTGPDMGGRGAIDPRRGSPGRERSDPSHRAPRRARVSSRWHVGRSLACSRRADSARGVRASRRCPKGQMRTSRCGAGSGRSELAGVRVEVAARGTFTAEGACRIDRPTSPRSGMGKRRRAATGSGALELRPRSVRIRG